MVKWLTMWCGGARLFGNLLVGPVPYDLVVGHDWLNEHKVAWYFQSDKLHTYVNGQWCELPIARANGEKHRNGSTPEERQRTPAEQAYDILAKEVTGMRREEARARLQPPPRRYKAHTGAGKKATAEVLLQQANESRACLHHPLHGLFVILALPAAEKIVALRLLDACQGALCCAMIDTHPTASGLACLAAPDATALADDEEEPPWSTAVLECTQFDEWMTSEEAQATPRETLDVLRALRAFLPDKLPTGLPPKRPYDHRILLVRGKLPTKSAIYRMTPDQLRFHKQEIAKLSANGWIGPTYSPICALTIMLDKRDDGTGERKMRMVVKEVNALTIAPDFPLPPIQTILEM